MKKEALFIDGPLDGQEIAVPETTMTFYVPVGVDVPDVWADEQEAPTAAQPHFERHVYQRMRNRYTGYVNVFEYKGKS